MRSLFHATARLFSAPLSPSNRTRVRKMLERNPGMRGWVRRLPGRMKLEGRIFQTDVGAPSFITRLAFLTGVYELNERRLIRTGLLPKVPTLEIGAGLGLISYTAWRVAQHPPLVVVEANPAVVEVLRMNLQENGVPVVVVHSALGYSGQRTNLIVGDSWVSGKIDQQKVEADNQSVPVTSLARLLEEHFGTDERVQVILDVEGMEWEMIHREADLIKRRVTRIIVELHGEENPPDLIEKGRRAFGDLGFRELASRGNVACYAADELGSCLKNNPE